MSDCPNCGADSSQVVSFWEDPADEEAGNQPDWFGCKECHRMMRVDLLRQSDEETPPQAELTSRERQRLAAKNRVGNQHTQRLSVIGWQVVKGAAMHYGVEDWMETADSTLTPEENVSLIERAGYQNKETTMREMKSPNEYKHGRRPDET